MSYKRIWVVLIGLIRKADYFTPSLQNLLVARDQGLIEGIVFSTWKGEVDTVRGLRSYLRENKIILVECDPVESLTAGLGGNIERQKYLFYWGLNYVPQNVYVFKSRPDQVITVTDAFFNLLRHLHNVDLSVDPADEAILPARIWCGRFAPNIPFWYDDRYFFTTSNVAFRMAQISADLRLVAHPTNYIAEINWYHPLFTRVAQWPNAMMQVNWMALAFLPSAEAIDTYKNALMESMFYWVSIALYGEVTERFFRVGCPGFALSDYDFLGPDSRRIAEVPMVFDKFSDFYASFLTRPDFIEATTMVKNLLSEEINSLSFWRELITQFAMQSPQYRQFIIGPVTS